MKKFVLASALCTGLAATSLSAHAYEGMGLGVGAKVGTLGYGLELSKGITDYVNVRAGFNTYSYSTSKSESDVDYDLDADWRTTGLMLDVHPLAGSFRLTLGYVSNGNKITMKARPSAATYDIGGTTYNSADVASLTGKVTFGNGLFYGLGWGNAGDGKGLGFSFELGMLRQTPDLSLDLQLEPAAAVLYPNLEQDVAREEADAQKDLEDFDNYPVIAVGISYSF